MAERLAAPGQLLTRIGESANGDTILLTDGDHNHGVFSINKDLVLQWTGWSPNGAAVTGPARVLPCKITAAINQNARVEFRGITVDGREDLRGPGTLLSLGPTALVDSTLLNRTGVPDVGAIGTAGTGCIGWTLGGAGGRARASRLIRSRVYGVGTWGAGLHQAVYYKASDELYVEDSLVHHNAAYGPHFYPNGLDSLWKRTLVAYNGRGIVWSGAADASTGLSGYLSSNRNLFERCIVSHRQGASNYLLESEWSGGPAGTGNGINDSIVFDPTSSREREPGATGFSVGADVIRVDPQYLNAATGDFTITNPAAAGYGPTQIQPGGAPPPPPPPPADTDLDPGQEKFGRSVMPTSGGGWKGMSNDAKRGFAYTAPAGRRITQVRVRMRGSGTTTSTQPIRVAVYNDATEAKLGQSNEQVLAENMAEGTVAFTFASPVVLPANGGAIRLALHSGARSGSPTGEIQYAYADVVGALMFNADTYADGASDPYGAITDRTNQEAVMWARTEAVPSAPAGTSLEATFELGAAVTIGTSTVGAPIEVRYFEEQETCPYCHGAGVVDVSRAYEVIAGARQGRVHWVPGTGWLPGPGV